MEAIRSNAPRNWRGQSWRYGLRIHVQRELNGDVSATSEAPLGVLDYVLGVVSVSAAIQSMEQTQALVASPDLKTHEVGVALASHAFRQLVGAK